MQQSAHSDFRAAFDVPAQKIVSWDEMHAHVRELQHQQFTASENLFESFVDFPHKMWLYLKRGAGEAYVDLLGKPGALPRYGHAYEDAASGDIYVDRAAVEGDLEFEIENGVNKTFQEKTAAITRDAFAQSQDFSMLVDTGQLRRIDT